MPNTKTILVTGGLGYIGSHTIVELFNEGYKKVNNIQYNFEVVIIDDCSSCSEKIIPLLEGMIKHKIYFYKVSLNDKQLLEEPFKKFKFDAAIHFAGKKSVNESIEKPLYYYENNFIGTFNLIELCLKYKVNIFINLFNSKRLISFFQALVQYMMTGEINLKKMKNFYFQLILMENLNYLLNIC